MRRRLGAAALGLGLLGTTLAAAGSAVGHGYTSTPPSRAALCAQRVVTGCGDIQWEPQSVEGPKGFPSAGPADGRICSGGNTRFAELDDPRGGNWPATQLTGGQGYDFKWTLTARHATTSFRYFITRDGWDPTRPLTRADLEPEPFMTVYYGGRQPEAVAVHRGTVPTQKTGRHLILGVWDIADTVNAFYSCADVRF
ncbi:lytic polysaccharide monooxygenase auxiliary activity family 9 protein [Streptomyces sp. HB2AG]|uniref:lytic polysaccharide monooxygenase auxiliary activity family 9 protein n=1 Tax=Streptomyces sp. HB2AG TaxID=2983400 RepID=UPI0022AA3620|nr:lytic polysaccharide monooxygenase auxiliary activity family 9 protein [Streptomyces sp. HB2AG]MCZ2526350.1 lytic polysaccharide monooxygenase [Streptomyces sp. HB2AG]